MTKVFYSTPFCKGDIGKGINDFISLLPDDAWVCLRDSDTLFLTHRAQQQIDDIVNSDPPFDVIGCRTNRLRSDYQVHDRERLFECPDIREHLLTAKQLEADNWCHLTELPAPEVVAGMFMLFRVSLWKRIKFERKSIWFDIAFCNTVRAIGGRLAIAQGIYLFHLYRFGQSDPYSYTEHLK